MNPVKQRPNKTGISTKHQFIKEKEKKILKHYTNCTVTSITTGRKRGGRGMIIWCVDNIIHKIQSYELRWVTKQVITWRISHLTSVQASVLFCNKVQRSLDWHLNPHKASPYYQNALWLTEQFMYKIVPKNENPLKHFVLNKSFSTPSAASFLVTEEREKPLPNWP